LISPDVAPLKPYDKICIERYAKEKGLGDTLWK